MSEKKSKKIADGRFSRLCRMGPVKKVVAALEAGGGETMEWTWTPLMRWVAHWDDCERRDGLTVAVVRALIDAGADVNAKDERGRTALMLALDTGIDPYEHHGDKASSETAEVVKILIESGADINMQNDEGTTALRYAARLYHRRRPAEAEEIILRLLKAGADVNARNEDGETALLLAAEGGGPEGLAALLDAGADVNAQDDFGQTALMSSAHKNPNAEVMGALIDAGAELDARDCAGRTALIRSVMHDGSKDYQFYSLTFNLLLDAGADPNIVDDEGKRAIDYARENRDLKWWHERDLQRLEEISRQAAGERS